MVQSSASQKEIKDAFRELILKYHPDKNASHEATERTHEIIEAYKILTDGDAKIRYDRVYRAYFGALDSAYSDQNTSETQDSKGPEFDDPILQKWIRSAQRQAKVELENLVSDLPEAIGVAAKGAVEYVVCYLVISILLLILLRAFISR